MQDITGYPLKEALLQISREGRYVIKIIKLIGINKKFNTLTNPYVIKKHIENEYLELYVTYY